jgi:hypothetical protein
MFGFMENSVDHEGYIASLEVVLPILVRAAVGTSWMQSLLLSSSMLSGSTRAAMKSFEGVEIAARTCVAKRRAAAPDRQDLMGHLLNIMHTKGEKVDFGVGEVEQEANTAL